LELKTFFDGLAVYMTCKNLAYIAKNH